MMLYCPEVWQPAKRIRIVRLVLVLLVFLILAVGTGSVYEAEAQARVEDQLRRQPVDRYLLERFGSGEIPSLNATTKDFVSPIDTLDQGSTLQSVPGYHREPEYQSRLEADYEDRLKTQAPEFAEAGLRQFGYQLLRHMTGLQQPGTGGAINDNYRLGIGDELVITFRGQANDSYRTAVDREGQVFLPNMPPVPAAGLTFDQFRFQLQREVSASFVRTEVFVSLGRVRNFPVMVLGQVRRPGVHRMTGISSVFDAIASAGGVQKSGSLRHIRLIRGGRYLGVDLYDLLLTGQMEHELSLMEGDRVFVPSIGKTIGVAGDIQRPGIYEVNGRSDDITVGEAVELAGGTLRPSGYRYMVMSSEDEGGDALIEVDDPEDAKVHQGDMILVAKMGYSWEGAVFLDGHVSVPGPRSLRWDRTVGGVVNAPDTLKENPYLLFAVLETTDPVTKARHFVPVDLGRITAGLSDVPLKPNDRLIVLSMDDIRFLSSAAVQAVLKGQNPDDVLAAELAGSLIEPVDSPGFDYAADERLRVFGTERSVRGYPNSPDPRITSGRTSDLQASARPIGLSPGDSSKDGLVGSDRRVCKGLHALASVVSRSRSERFAKARLFLNPQTKAALPTSGPCPRIYDRFPALLPFVLDYVVAVQGEVRMPGVYPVAPEAPAASLVPVAGGVTPEADLAQIELSRFQPARDGSGETSVRTIVDARTTSLAGIGLRSGDIVRFNQRYSQRDAGSVFLSGEVKRPGVYTIRRGERLSEIIDRAGGLTEEAYPPASVFTRERVRKQEQKEFERAALDLESGLAEALASGNIQQKSDADPEAVVLAVKELANTLRQTQAVGRVVVESDPTVLDVRPELNTILEAGDRLHVPKRPNHVTVSGEVLNPGTIQFRSGNSADQYVNAAGGTTRAADEGRIFVVLPNGEAQPVSISAWNYTSVQIPPGSIVVVPRDPKPFDLTAFSVTMADIMSKMAISAASLWVITQ